MESSLLNGHNTAPIHAHGGVSSAGAAANAPFASSKNS